MSQSDDGAVAPGSAHSPAPVWRIAAGAPARCLPDDEGASTTRPTVATWRSLPAEAPWCPAELREALPWAAASTYADRFALEGRVRVGIDDWHILAMSQRGRVHAHAGTHREDDAAGTWSSLGFALAVADGAGSSRWSRVGSACVCRHVRDAARSLLHAGTVPTPDSARSALIQAVVQASEQLQQAAAAAGGAPRDFRTTVLAAVCLGDVLVTMQVGDGAVVLRSRDGAVRRIGAGDGGGYSGEVSAFVPELEHAGLIARTLLTPVHDMDAILLLSDGIEDPFYPIERHGAEIIRQLCAGVRAPAPGFAAQRAHGPVVDHPDALLRLGEWLAFERRGENDDRTLAGAFRLPPTPRQ